MSLESMPRHGEDLARSFKAEGPRLLSLESSPAQVFLSQAAYPNLAPEHAIQKWVLEDAEAFRSYIEDRKERQESMDIDIGDPAQLHEILTAMREPRTLH